MSARYERSANGMPVCMECGAVVPRGRMDVHDRFHSILDDRGRAIAVLVTSHLGPRIHDRYDVRERIGPTPATSWSREAFEEVVDDHLTHDPVDPDTTP